LPNETTTRRYLRDFGAVATVPNSRTPHAPHAVEAAIAAAPASAPASNVPRVDHAGEMGVKAPAAPPADAGTPLPKQAENLQKLLLLQRLHDEIAAQRAVILDPADRAKLNDLRNELVNKLKIPLKRNPTDEELLKQVNGEIDQLKRALLRPGGTESYGPGLLASSVAGSPSGTGSPSPYGSGGPSPSTCLDGRVPRDPFSYVPRVTVVRLNAPRPCRDEGAGDDEEGSSPFYRETPPPVDSLADDRTGRVWTYHFDHPARFPSQNFGPSYATSSDGTTCCAFEGQGAVIHEGMRLLARTDGKYEVRFNITAPATVVTMRLQLILHDLGNHVPRTLTLPPIVLKPSQNDFFDDDLAQKFDPVSYIVSVQGYSQVVLETQSPIATTTDPRADHFLLVKRAGSARFGSGVRYQTRP
jgi:hypothetical protein